MQSRCVVSIIALLACACGGQEKPASSSTESPTPEVREPSAPVTATEKPQAPPAAIDPARTGSVRGVVSFKGVPPARKPIDVGTAGCPHEGDILTETVIVNGEGRLQNVFVRVTAGLEPWTIPPPPTEPAHLDQKSCVYSPHVSGVRVGQKLVVLNSDPVAHNVHARPKRPRNGEDINETQPASAGAGLPLSFGEEEVMVPFGCDIHPWMRAYVGVVAHPFFAVTDAEGRFEIPGLPEGYYKLEAWHESLKRQQLEVTVVAGAAADANFTFAP
jgi:plastocyanin